MTNEPASHHTVPAVRFFPEGDSFGSRLVRRSITVPLYAGGWLLLVLLSPALFPIAAASDAVRRNRWAVTRGLLFAHVYLFCEVAAVAVSAWTWLRIRGRGEAWLASHYRLQAWWTRTQYLAAVRIFGLDVRINGEEALAPAPFILFVRHVSVVDNLIPAVIVAGPLNARFRWVLNASLLRDPALDIVGHRLPNEFVRGGGTDSERQIQKVRELAAARAPDEGVVNYPEGGLFSPARRDRLIRRFRERGEEELARNAESFTTVLPPRLGGAAAIVESCPGLDIVFCAHSGIEKVNQYRTLANGSLIHAALDIGFWRISAASIPHEPAAFATWLNTEWRKVDAWVAAHSGRPPAPVR